MNENATQPVFIDIRDLLLSILKKIGVIVVFSIIIAVIGMVVSILETSHTDAVQEGIHSILDTNSRLENETDEEYSNRVMNVSRANGIMDYLSVLNNQVLIQYTYLNDSILMQIDPNNVSCSQAQLVVTCDNDGTYGVMETLLFIYENSIKKGDYLQTVAQEYGCDEGYISELITVDLSYSSVDDSITLYESSIRRCAISVCVVGDSIDFTDAILDSVLNAINEKSNELNSEGYIHTLEVASMQESVYYDDDIRYKQLDAVGTINNLQNQINSLNGSLDNIAKALGLGDRNSFYLSDKDLSDTNMLNDMIKAAFIGFALGFILIIGYYTFVYIWGKKIQTQKQFYNNFNQLIKIGVCKPSGKRSRYISFIDRKTSDDCELSEEDVNKLIFNNYQNLTRGLNRILITGTSDEKAVSELLKRLNIKADIKLNLFRNPDVLGDAASYDGIVLLEQRGVSEKKSVKEEIRLLENSGKKIVGAILL